MPFVLAGVCWGCVNDDSEKLFDRGIQLTFKGGGGEYKIFENNLNPQKSLSNVYY